MATMIFAGRPGHSSQLGGHLAGGLLIAASLGLLGWLLAGRGMHLHDNLQNAGFVGVIVLAVAGLFFTLRALLRVATVRYRIDDARLEVERGLMVKKIDNLELWRVKDIRFRQGLLQRMFSTGDVEMDSDDASDPTLVLHGIPGARALYEKLRDAINAARKRQGVLAVENSSAL